MYLSACYLAKYFFTFVLPIKSESKKAALKTYINLLCWIRKIEAHIDTSKYWNFIQKNLNWNDFISHLEVKGRYLILLKAKQKTCEELPIWETVLWNAEEKKYRKADNEEVAYQPEVQTSAQATVSTPYSHSQFSSWFLARISPWFWQHFK